MNDNENLVNTERFKIYGNTI